jgi:hypothetical protein
MTPEPREIRHVMILYIRPLKEKVCIQAIMHHASCIKTLQVSEFVVSSHRIHLKITDFGVILIHHVDQSQTTQDLQQRMITTTWILIYRSWEYPTRKRSGCIRYQKQPWKACLIGDTLAHPL